MSSEFVTIDRLRKDDASSKTARMSWFATSSWTISRREKTIFTSSLERHRFMLLLKKCESTHHKYPILFPMHVLFDDSKVKFFLLTRCQGCFSCISLNFGHVDFRQIRSSP